MKLTTLFLFAGFFYFSCLSSAEQPTSGPTQKTDSGEPSAYSPEQIRELEAKAIQGDSSAQCSLALCYGKGDGISKDYDKAFYWATKAAQ